MRITKKNVQTFNLFIAFFLAFAGYYVVLMVMINLGLREASQIATIPMRLLIVACLGIAFLIKPNIKVQNALIFFLLFSLFYYGRITFEALKGTSSFHLPVIDFFLYYTSFVCLPLLFISQMELNHKDYSRLFYAIIIGSLLMSIGTYFYYADLLGEVTRIGGGEKNINPLALSYTATLGIGVGISYLLTNKVANVKKMGVYITVVLCLIPFFLGASRGSVIALFIPFIFYFLFSEKAKNKVMVITTLLGLGIVFLIASQYLGLGVFNRFLNIDNAIQSASQEASRIHIWYNSWNQYLENPWFGNSLEANSIGFYPHNILLESLITTGFFGFLFFISFIILVLRKSILIINKCPSYFFIVVVFLQALSQNMFSGSLYGASWLAISAATIISFNTKFFQRPLKI